MKVKNKDLKGKIANFPKRVVQAMVDEQVRQGNKADPSVFAHYLSANKIEGGFDWDEFCKKAEFEEKYLYAVTVRAAAEVHRQGKTGGWDK